MGVYDLSNLLIIMKKRKENKRKNVCQCHVSYGSSQILMCIKMSGELLKAQVKFLKFHLANPA
jgi:hypothetical protein